MLGNLLEKVRSLKPLKGFCGVTVRLYYYDDVTPLEYEPPCFKRSQTQRPYFDGQPTMIKVGVDDDNVPLKTPYHELSLSIQSVLAEKDGGDKEKDKVAQQQSEMETQSSQRSRYSGKLKEERVTKLIGDKGSDNNVAMEDVTKVAPIQESQGNEIMKPFTLSYSYN
jgi:hypothetical protein